MAWITKNSGTMQIDRRTEPYLTDEMKGDLEAKVLPRYPTRRASTLPCLHAVQERYNYIPHQAIEEIAAFLGLQASEVLDTCTFYEMFFTQPRGKYVVWVCESISCELMNHDALIHRLEEKLGIVPGETTSDGKITLMHAECLGACGGAPCALVGEKLHENLTVESLDRIIDSLE